MEKSILRDRLIDRAFFQDRLKFSKDFSVTQNKIYNSSQTFKSPYSATCDLLGLNRGSADWSALYHIREKDMSQDEMGKATPKAELKLLIIRQHLTNFCFHFCVEIAFQKHSLNSWSPLQFFITALWAHCPSGWTKKYHSGWFQEVVKFRLGTILFLQTMQFLITLKGALLGLTQFLPTESATKVMKNAFYFTLKALFILKIFQFLYWLLGHVEKRAD